MAIAALRILYVAGLCARQGQPAGALAELSAVGMKQVAFAFWNIGAKASGIPKSTLMTAPFWALRRRRAVPVSHSRGAKPPDLPCGQTASPPFPGDGGLSSGATNPAPIEGVNNTAAVMEWVKITFCLINGQTFADTLNAPFGGVDGGLRIGIHIIGLANGGSDSCVNNPPPVKTPEVGINGDAPGPWFRAPRFGYRRLA